MAAKILEPIPIDAPMTEQGKGKGETGFGWCTEQWFRWLSGLSTRSNKSPERVALVELTDQSASIAATSLSIASITAGYYEVSYYARVTRAAGVSSSLTVSFGWTESAQGLSLSGAAITGNLVTSVQSGVLPLILVDAASPITYSTTYASVGAPTMQYRLSVMAKKVSA